MVSILLFGGNEEGTLQAFMKARELIVELPGNILFESDVIETKPEEDLKQPDFFNSIMAFETHLNPIQLLEKLQNLELKIGRKRDLDRPKGPRLIDIDILFYEDFQIGTEILTIPHPQVYKRKFVGKLLKQIPSKYQQFFPEGFEA